MAGPVVVGLHPCLAPWAQEAKYALRTLLRIAGLPRVFVWAGADGVANDVDLYYGPRGSVCETAYLPCLLDGKPSARHDADGGTDESQHAAARHVDGGRDG
jgi:hypothetical protein